MTREQIREAIIEMDCLNRKEADELATMIFRAAETGKEEDRQKVTAVIDWLYATDSITLLNGLEMKDLYF